MVRNYKPKRCESPPSEEVLKTAIIEVIEERMTIRVASEYFGVKKSTLGGHVKKVMINGGRIPDVIKPRKHSRSVFSSEMEAMLMSYLLSCSLMAHGLTPSQAKELAYSFAIANNLTVEQSWHENKRAGRDWFSGFMKRNPTLSIRSPEATSQARASGFNMPVVQKFLTICWK